MSLPYASTGPHIHSRDSVSKIMWRVVAALLPAIFGAYLFFGPRALYGIFGTALFCVLFEFLLVPERFSAKQPIGDGSALVAGLILGLSLSPGVSWWIPPVGAFILITLGKQVFGGIGNNIFNPALVARGVLLLSWPKQLTDWVTPFDGLTSATPLETMDAEYVNLLTGNVAGSLGETSALAMLLGAGLLIYQGLINWKVPLSVIVGALAAALLFGLDPLFTLLSGSLLFAAVFMATDMVTSPTGKTAHLAFGFCCGFLTVFIRAFTLYPEGVTFAFLIMNGLAYLMDRIGMDPIFGQVHERYQRRLNTAASFGATLILLTAVALSLAGSSYAGARYADAALSRAVRKAFPAAERIAGMSSFDPAVQRYRVYQERRLLGLFADVSVAGYGGPMRIYVTLDAEGAVSTVRLGPHRESPTLGSRAASPAFLSRFAGFHPDNRGEIQDTVEGITGATVSARAVMNALERVLGAGDASAHAAAASPLPSVADGVYEGTGRGYHGPITLSVTMQGGRIAEIAVAGHRETAGIGTRALETLIDGVLSAQSLSLDAVSGATGTSRGFLAAVSDALQGH